MKILNKFIFLGTLLSLCSIAFFIYDFINIGKFNSIDSIIPLFVIGLSIIVAVLLSLVGIIISTISKRKGVLLTIKIKDKEFNFIHLYRNVIILVISIYPAAFIVAGIVNLFKVLPIWLGLK